ncbi:UPF0703 protein YcgQ [Paenibacillus baekrokdamisoli]|uniref:UPF0703 protein YcgQ n=1 Tax=Paenibacillus baekrokdamisoli TaxID=1712516 RepID=A0A3G9IRT7_9BACL|nr:TIGR03943 family protein [Paenibacillus baekrokdamisoli]MBB3069357.1 putative repeat protein (TIGR03943 family) [Paenibacillus baekrokdamisoli]BBH18675.1 UPF0703 protein YcgQ [Paenibacillus baekrokdamisoli]
MKDTYAPIIHHFLRLAILLGFTLFLAHLTMSGEILLFIAPQLVKYVQLAAGGLLTFTIFQIYFFIRSFKNPAPVCACGHDHGHSHEGEHAHGFGHEHSHEPARSLWKNILLYGLFIMPLLFGAFLPNEAFAGSLAKNKGMNLGGTTEGSNGVPADLAQLEGSEDSSVKELFQTDNYNRDYAKLGMLLYKQDLIEMKDEWFIEKLQALNTFAANFEGKQIKVKGFIYREDGLSEDQFIIGRMAMTHCIADISPYGMIAEAPDASSYADDSWVTLTGTIATTTYHNQTVIKILIQSVEAAHAPTIPYIYPDWDFAKKLQ